MGEFASANIFWPVRGCADNKMQGQLAECEKNLHNVNITNFGILQT